MTAAPQRLPKLSQELKILNRNSKEYAIKAGVSWSLIRQ